MKRFLCSLPVGVLFCSSEHAGAGGKRQYSPTGGPKGETVRAEGSGGLPGAHAGAKHPAEGATEASGKDHPGLLPRQLGGAGEAAERARSAGDGAGSH